MTQSTLPLQAAIHGALTAAFGGSPLPLGYAVAVHDDVPQDAAFPYVQIGDDTTVADWSALAREREEVSFHLHTWSRYRGKKEALEIMGAIKAALQNARDLSVTGWTIAGIREDFATIFLDPDGRTRHGVQRFRALLRKA